MDEKNEKDMRRDASDFIEEKKAVDKAINERIKSETEDDKIDPRAANNKSRIDYDPRDSVKKTGRTKE